MNYLYKFNIEPKYKLIMNDKNNTEDEIKFNSKDELLKFISEYTAERLIDRDFIEYDWTIIKEGE